MPPKVHRLDLREARRIAVRAQLLDGERDAIHQDVPFTKTMSKAVHSEIEALASWLGLGVSGIHPAT